MEEVEGILKGVEEEGGDLGEEVKEVEKKGIRGENVKEGGRSLWKRRRWKRLRKKNERQNRDQERSE